MKTSSPMIPSVLVLFGKGNPLMTEITCSVFTVHELCEHKTSSHVCTHERLPGGQIDWDKLQRRAEPHAPVSPDRVGWAAKNVRHRHMLEVARKSSARLTLENRTVHWLWVPKVQRVC